MAKILNLDDFASKETRVLSLGGVEYPVNEMSVDDFIEITAASQRLEKETDFGQQIKESKRLIQRAIPTITEDVLGKLNFDQLAAVSRFVRGEDVTAPAQEAAADTTGDASGNS